MVPLPAAFLAICGPLASPERAAFRADFMAPLNGKISCRNFKAGTKLRFDFASRLRKGKASGH